jgi:predicted RNA-binding Zn-ribbon protein involved in translation (DUF1610 family)
MRNSEAKEPPGVCPKCGSAIDHLIYRTIECNEYRYAAGHQLDQTSTTTLYGELCCPRCGNEVLTFKSEELAFNEADSILGTGERLTSHTVARLFWLGTWRK